MIAAENGPIPVLRSDTGASGTVSSNRQCRFADDTPVSGGDSVGTNFLEAARRNFTEPGLGFKPEIWNRQPLLAVPARCSRLQFAGEFSAFKSLVPSGKPQPVQASQAVPAANCPSSNPSVSLLPVMMSRSTPLGPIVL